MGKHKVSYRYCSSCSKYVLKKYYKSHVRKHDTGDTVEQVEEEGELDTSKDGEDEEEDEEGMDTSDPAVKGPSKIYNCVDCTRMFMSAEAHANHLRDVHGGEGGSEVLKLPRDKMAEKNVENDDNKEDNDENVDDELVIDDSQ